jgi:hypothetical protein
MEEFKSWSDSFNLTHLFTSGAEYTWQNGRGGLRHTEKRLDRAVCNQAWLDLCIVSAVSASTRHRSDHFPLLLEFQLHQVACASSFKFLRMWSMHSGCRQLIADYWSNLVVGSPMHILSTKLKMLKNTLKVWNKNCFGNVNDLVLSAESNLQQVQTQIQQLGHTDSLLDQESC